MVTLVDGPDEAPARGRGPTPDEADSSGQRARVRPTWRELAAAARTPRMLGLLALLVVAALVCARLGAWQIDRAFERADAARQAQAIELAETAAVPIETLLDPGAHVIGTQVGLPVTVEGEYDAAQQVLVPERVVAGEPGYLVVTPLQTHDGVWLAVVRGFVTSPELAPPVPDGEVRILASLAPGEAYAPADLPAGQVSSVSPALFAGQWGLPIYGAYAVLAQADGDATTVPRPELDGGGGVDLRNLAYAVEWYVFGAFALVVWYRLVRDEALTRREEAAASGAAATGADGAD